MSELHKVPFGTCTVASHAASQVVAGLLSAFAAALILALPSPAHASPKSLNGFIGGDSGLATGGLFTQPRDVAVYTAATPDPSDDKILVTEALGNNSRVHRTDSDGNFELLWGRDVVQAGIAGNTGSGYEICRAAVSGAGGCKRAPLGSQPGEFNNPTGVAVNNVTGRVYVMDAGNRRVQEFDIGGQFIRSWGWGVDTGSAAFEVCTTTCQAGRTGLAEGNANAGQFANADVNTIAISPSAPNHVFVTDSGNRRIMQFDANGNFVRAWGWGVDSGTDSGPDQFEVCTPTSSCQQGNSTGDPGRFASGSPNHIAIDDAGLVYASDTTDGDRIIRFDSDPAPLPPVASSALLAPLPSPTLLSAGSTKGLEVDPATGNLLVGRDPISGPTVVDEISDPAAELLPGGPPNPLVSDVHSFSDAGAVRGLGHDPGNGFIHLSATDLNTPPGGPFTGCISLVGACHGLLVLATTTGPLAAALEAPSNVGSTSASLEGSVEPGGGVARYRFEVSDDGTHWTPASEPVNVGGSGTTNVTAMATDLQPATLYRVRLAVSKQTGVATTEQVTTDEDIFLTDAAVPRVSTSGSAQRTDRSVRLRGFVDPQGSATSYRFEYGPAGGSFDHHIPIPDAQAGAGNSSQLVTHTVTGLQPGFTYHYRIVASNFVGTSTGDEVLFTTDKQTSPPSPPGRSYELVSPSDKVSGVGVGVWYNGPAASGWAGFAAHQGNRFAVQGTLGATLLDGKYTYANDWALAERTPEGWVNRPLMSRRAHGNQTIVFIHMKAATPDLSLTSWGETTVKLFTEMESWPKEVAGAALYLRDWEDGKWELFGPTAPTQGGGAGITGATAIAADGLSSVASGPIRGLAGLGDPTQDNSPTTHAVFLDEIPNGLSDTFPGTGARSVVNVCTPGTEIPARVEIGGAFKQASQACPPAPPNRDAALVSNQGATLGKDREAVISSDGSRVFYMAPDIGSAPGSCSGTDLTTSCPPQVYVRQRNSSSVVTRWISRTEVSAANGASSDQDASLMAPVLFEGASTDGDKVFFRTASPLTADDPNGQGQAPPAGGVVAGTPSQSSWDLYMYDMPDAPGADPADGDLIRISRGPTGEGDCNSPQGGASDVGALRLHSDDGRQLYFTCAAPLEDVPLTGDGTITDPAGTPSSQDASNLYAYDASEPLPQRWRFVARLPRNSAVGGCATTGTEQGMPLGPPNTADPKITLTSSRNCVHGSSDGSFITLWTDGQLTDDDPDATSGDIYAYDVDRDELTRITAPQGGAGGTYPCTPGNSGAQCYGDTGIGQGITSLPKLGIAETADDEHLAFFESRSRLIPQDKNDSYDVYQWDRNRRLSLISTGLPNATDTFFGGNDVAGRNVYLITRDRLSWQDQDSVLDVYSAHVSNGIPEPADPSETCAPVLDQCQAPGTSQPPSQVDSDTPADGNPLAAPRVTLEIGNLTRKARIKAARTGKLTVRIASSGGTPTVVLSAKARIAGKPRMIGRATQRLATTGRSTVTIRIIGAARKHLREHGVLRMTLSAKVLGGARSSASQVILKRRQPGQR